MKYILNALGIKTKKEQKDEKKMKRKEKIETEGVFSPKEKKWKRKERENTKTHMAKKISSASSDSEEEVDTKEELKQMIK